MFKVEISLTSVFFLLVNSCFHWLLCFSFTRLAFPCRHTVQFKRLYRSVTLRRLPSKTSCKWRTMRAQRWREILNILTADQMIAGLQNLVLNCVEGVGKTIFKCQTSVCLIKFSNFVSFLYRQFPSKDCAIKVFSNLVQLYSHIQDIKKTATKRLGHGASVSQFVPLIPSVFSSCAENVQNLNNRQKFLSYRKNYES